MRHPCDVAKQIRDIVPEKHQSIFDKLMRDFSYKAPELHGECFAKLSAYCDEILLDEDWKVKMISILTTKSKEELLIHL